MNSKQDKAVAVLSSTVLVYDGIYEVETLIAPPDLNGVPYYIGHPATEAIVKIFGAAKAQTNQFEGLEVGQSAICVSIKPAFNARIRDGVTNPNQDVTIDKLDFRLLRRIK